MADLFDLWRERCAVADAGEDEESGFEEPLEVSA
jgi:hypothetical protein